MIWWTIRQLNSSKPGARIVAARKLGGAGQKRAVPALLRTLADEDPLVRTAAAEALAKLPHPAAAEPLAAALENAATSRMGKTETGVAEYKALAEAIAAQGDGAVRPLTSLLSSQHKDARLWAAWAMGRIASAELVPVLAGALEDRRSDVRREAALALGAIADRTALEPLLKAIANRDPETRRAAAEALARFAHEKSLKALEDATKDTDESVQRAAVASIAAMGTVAAALHLKAAVESDRKAVREDALAALSAPELKPQEPDETAALAVLRGDTETALAQGEFAVPHLLDAMRSRDAARRLEAARALRQLKPFHAIPGFLRALRDPELSVREVATEALIEIGDPAVEGLVGAASSLDATVQHFAATALGRIGNPAAAEALAGIIIRNRRTAAEYTEPLDAARAAAYALHSVLRRNAASIAPADLNRICEVPDVIVESASLTDPQLLVTETGIDCGPIRDLARQEISRRLPS